MEKKQQWLVSIWFVLALTIGASIVRTLGGLLFSYFVQHDHIISDSEGGIIIGLEMVIVLLFGLVGFAVPMKMQPKEILQLAWKISLLTAIIGFIIGVTYTAGLQNISCGFIHSV